MTDLPAREADTIPAWKARQRFYDFLVGLRDDDGIAEFKVRDYLPAVIRMTGRRSAWVYATAELFTHMTHHGPAILRQVAAREPYQIIGGVTEDAA